MASFLRGETGVIIRITIGMFYLEEKVDKEEACMVGFQKSSDPTDFIIKLAEKGAMTSKNALSLTPRSVHYSGSITAKTTHLGERHVVLPEGLEFPAHLIEVIEADMNNQHARPFSEFLNFAAHCQDVVRIVKAKRETTQWGREQIERFRENRLRLSKYLTNTK